MNDNKKQQLEHDIAVEQQYAKILSDLLSYIYQKRCQNAEEPLVNIITDFCFKSGLEPELVGDAIREDYYMQEFVMKDCVVNNIDRFSYVKDITPLDDW